jgi:hypothetical protein
MKFALAPRMPRIRMRRYQQNLAGIDDQWIDVGAGVASLLFFATGARRLAGAVSIAESAWLLSRNKNISGWAGLIIGASFLLFPTWPERLLTPAKTDTGA